MLISRQFIEHEQTSAAIDREDYYPLIFPSVLERVRYFHDTPNVRLHEMYPGKTVDHESYRSCQCELAAWLRERMNREPMDEEIRLNGPFQNMSEQDFRVIFNKHAALVHKMTNEELLQHRAKLANAIKQLRIRDFAAHEVESERIADMDRAEREEFRQKSLKYKPKPQVEDENHAPRQRREAKSPEEKAVAALMTALGMTEQEARDFIAKKKGGN